MSYRDDLIKFKKILSKEIFEIYRVIDLDFDKDKKNNIIFENQDNLDSNDNKYLPFYFENWDNYLKFAILPDFLSGPDICIFFSTYLMVFSIALKGFKVQKEKLLKNYKRSNPLYFYCQENGEVQTGQQNNHETCLKNIIKRFKSQKLQYIIRIHIVLPDSSKEQSGLFYQNCISYDELKIKNQYIPSIVIDISGQDIEKTNIFSSDIIKILRKKSETTEKEDKNVIQKEESNKEEKIIENEVLNPKKRKIDNNSFEINKKKF
jgi:hypothetical protein